MKEHKELTVNDKFGLIEFWEYCFSLEEYMKTRIDDPEAKNNPDYNLPLFNKMICVAFAAHNYKDHCNEIDDDNLNEEKCEAFQKEYGEDIWFLKWAKPGFNLRQLMWYGDATRARNIIEKNGIDTVDKLLAATDDDFLKMSGIGKKVLNTIHECQKSARAHNEFFERHKEWYETSSNSDNT